LTTTIDHASNRSGASRLLRAGLLTGIVDGLFSTVLTVFFYNSTATRLWQSVASTLLGPASFEGGMRTAAIGLLMHFGVAFGWSAVFLLLWRIDWIRSIVDSPGGVVKASAVYGPLIWVVMSCAVIPMLVHRPPSITYRWWVQLIGHWPFVGVPIVSMIARRHFRYH
jgi:hypothetical protein